MGEAKRRQAHIAAGGDDWGLTGYRSSGTPRYVASFRRKIVAAFVFLKLFVLRAELREKIANGELAGR